MLNWFQHPSQHGEILNQVQDDNEETGEKKEQLRMGFSFFFPTTCSPSHMRVGSLNSGKNDR